MATYSINTHTIVAGEDEYDLSFSGATPGYIEEAHVRYYIAGVLQDNSLRTFLTATRVQINPVPVDGTVISFRRETSPDEAIIDWAAGEGVNEIDLDTNTLQLLYLSQEASDRGFIDTSDAEAFSDKAEQWAEEPEDSEVETGKYSALHHATKSIAGSVSATASASAAGIAQTEAETAQTAAELAETNAETAETNAAASAAAIAGVNSNITSMTGLDDDGIPVVKVAGALVNIVEDVSPELGGNLDCIDRLVSRAYFSDSAEKTQVKGTITTNTEITVAGGNVVTCTIGADLILSFTNPPTSGRTGFLILEITNGGAYTVTFPTSVSWDSGSAPDLQVSGVDIITFITRDAGTTWRGIRGWREA